MNQSWTSETRSFHCPEWERGTCNCPGGTVRPECPGLAALNAQRAPRADDDARAGAGLVWLLICTACTLMGVAIGKLL